MLSFKLALRNLLGAGLKTWLNVIVLSMSFVLIIFYNGMIDGWNEQAVNDTIAWEIGQGQVWQRDYDPYDPYTLLDAHAVVPNSLQSQVQSGAVASVLITQASVYPEGRMQSILLKGISSEQKILELPTQVLKNTEAGMTNAIIGKSMSDATKLKAGDNVLLRWRDKNGTFDATEIHIAEVFDTDVPSIDGGQVWIDLEKMRSMTGLSNEATLLVTGDNYQAVENKNWIFKSHEVLLADLTEMISAKKGGAAVMYILLMGIALLAIFDTQVLSIFRRQKEIGTYIALGMTRWQVVKLFTIEGGAHSILAVLVGAIYGVPLFYYLTQVGIPVPTSSADAGIPISSEIFPVYGVSLVVGTILLIVIASTVVSFMPARRIARINPTEALKGKVL